MSEKAAERAHRMEVIGFCPACFASGDGGSWGCDVIGGAGGYCTNCGAGGAIAIPRWAVGEIRRNASWVGRRYYPGDEDRENHAERIALLNNVKVFPGRKATPARKLNDAREWEPDPGRWEVRQDIGGGRCMMTWVSAASAEEAIEKTRHSLRYVPVPL